MRTIVKTAFCICSGIILFTSCGKDETFTENKEDILTTEEVKSIRREDSTVPRVIHFTKGEYEGMKLFMRNCNKCHPGGEKGEGPSLNDKNLPDFLIHFQVRNGLGAMPAFKKDDISKDQLKKIILFVNLMRDTHNG